MNLIVSTSKNGVIGLNGQMLWNISSDINRYRKITKGGILIMGHTTYKSLRKKRLTYHYNIVISSHEHKDLYFKEPYGTSEVIFVRNMYQAIEVANELAAKYTKEIFVIGGKSIYEQFEKTNLITKIYHTIVDKNFTDNQKYTIYTPNVQDFKLIHDENILDTNNTFKTIFRIYVK